MTVTTTTQSVTLAANNATTQFAFPYVGVAASDIVVSVTNSSNQTTTLLSSQYSVNINQPTTGQLWGVGGYVLYPLVGSPLASGNTVTISRILPLTQQVSLSDQGDYNPSITEQAIDTLCMEIQQVAARTGKYRGTWTTSTAYNYADIVQDGPAGLDSLSYYMCTQSYTSTSSWSADLAAGYWTLIIQSVAPTLAVPISIANGGTGQTTAAAALSALGGVSLTASNTFTGSNEFTLPVGFGAVANAYQINVVQAGANQAYFGSTGANNSVVVLDNAAGGQVSQLFLANAGVNKWQIEKAADNSFYLYDEVGAAAFIHAVTGGNLVLGPNQNTYIDQSGHVGIGTSSTGTYQLSVVQAGTNQAYFGSTGANTAQVVLDNAAGGNGVYIEYKDAGTLKWTLGKQTDNSFLLLDVAGSKYFMTAVTGGNLTLGPLQNVSVGSTGPLAVTVQPATNGIVVQNTSGTSTYTGMYFATNGGGTQVGSISVTSTATAYNTSSDKRLKNNVAPLANIGAKIDSMAPVTYNWQYLEGNPSGVGFLAQDLYEIAPEAVSVGDDGTVDANGKVESQWSVDYSKLVPYLVAELQAVRIRLAALEAKAGITPTVN